MILVTLYSRQECLLCEQVRADLESLCEESPHTLVVVDIDSHTELQAKYGSEIPVVEVGPLVLKAPITRQELAQALTYATTQERSGTAQSTPEANLTRSNDAKWTKSDAFTYWFSRHYMLVFNLFFGLYVFLPFMAPVLMNSGVVGPASVIYRVYGAICHQLSYRSFFLSGEQLVYPRAAAGIDDLLTFSQATGLKEDNDAADVYAAREFVGNETVGYKVALCERDVAIYGSIFVFGLLFALTGRRIKALPWYLWVLFGLMPIAIDGLSQLLSQPPFAFLPYRESTPLFRIITGAMFGITTAWFGYPMIEQTMADTRQMMENKKTRTGRAQRLAAK
jgi:uncharacterized membrane protein